MKTMERLGWLLFSLSLPIFFLLTAVRVLFTPLYPRVEYQMPGFPEDELGFTAEERLTHALKAVEYITQASAALTLLSDAKFEDGSPLYVERELSHMMDVKVVFQNAVLAHWILTGFYAVVIVILATRKKMRGFWLALQRGGWYTIGLTAFILAAVAISFNTLFTVFHSLFFEGDSWIFLWTDTLIRLFPPRLWQDAFITVGGITLLLAVLAIWLGGRFARQSHRNEYLPGN